MVLRGARIVRLNDRTLLYLVLSCSLDYVYKVGGMRGQKEISLGMQELKRLGTAIVNDKRDKILTFLCDANINLSCK